MKIVITGAPKIGKTTLVHIMSHEFSNKVVLCDDTIDVASVCFFAGAQTDYEMKCRQRAIFHLQKELEDIAVHKAKGRLVLCDHGSLDCLADWPESPMDFFREVHSSVENELSRYDWVIHINGTRQTGKTSSLEPSISPRTFWKRHPHFLEVTIGTGFSSCCNQVARILHKILDGQPYEEIRDGVVLSEAHGISEIQQ